MGLLKSDRLDNFSALWAFFALPNGERILTGTVWRDKDDKETHDPKKVVTKEPLMEWLDRDWNPTPIREKRVPERDRPFTLPQYRTAETEKDFETIYQRELKKAAIPDGNTFREHLTKKVNEMLQFEKGLPANSSKWSLPAQYVANEFLKWVDGTRSGKQNEDNKPTVAAYGIMHVYWSKHESNKAITKTNVNTLAEQYGTSKKTLLDAYNEYKPLANRLEPRENTRTITEHVKRYESILPLLETLCPKAFRDASKDLYQIKERYQSYLK